MLYSHIWWMAAHPEQNRRGWPQKALLGCVVLEGIAPLPFTVRMLWWNWFYPQLHEYWPIMVWYLTQVIIWTVLGILLKWPSKDILSSTDIKPSVEQFRLELLAAVLFWHRTTEWKQQRGKQSKKTWVLMVLVESLGRGYAWKESCHFSEPKNPLPPFFYLKWKYGD